MKVREVMSRRVISVSPDTSILQAGDLMLQHRISGLPVADAAGHVVGVVTERDFLRGLASRANAERPRWFEVLTRRSVIPDLSERFGARRIADVMTRDPATVTEDTPLEDALRLMEAGQIKRVPVVRNGQLVGIVSRADMLRALMQNLHAGAQMDAALRARLGEVERQSWLQRTRS